MTLEAAIEAVRLGHVQRVCEPGKWIVSRDITIQHLGGYDMASIPAPKPKPKPQHAPTEGQPQ
jgi:hypothetical protein